MKVRLAQMGGYPLSALSNGDTFLIGRNEIEGDTTVWVKGVTTSTSGGKPAIAVRGPAMDDSLPGAVHLPRAGDSYSGETTWYIPAMQLGSGRVLLLHPKTSVERVVLCGSEIVFRREIGPGRLHG